MPAVCIIVCLNGRQILMSLSLRLSLLFVLSSLICVTVHAQFGGLKIPKSTEIKKELKKDAENVIKEMGSGVVKEQPASSSESSSPAARSSSSDTRSGATSTSGRSDTPPASQSSTGSDRSSRERPGSNPSPSASELTPRKIYVYISKVYKREREYMFTDEVHAGLQNFDRAAYEAGDGKRGGEAGYSDRNAVNDVNRMLADFDNWLSSSNALKDFSLQRYNEAQGAQAPVDKLKAYEKVVKACEIVKKISPSNPAADEKLAEVRKLMAAVQKQMGGALTGEYHQMHLNQMVFSSKPFKPGEESSADIRSSFKSGETVYATIYLGRKVREATESYAQQPIQVRIDNNLRGMGNIWVTTPMQENTYLQFALIPGQEWLDANYKPYLDNKEIFYSDFLGNLSKELPISHEIKVKFEFRGYRAEKINAAFTYDMSDGAESLSTLANNLKNQGLNSVKVPPAGMSNPALEREMLAICKQRFPNDTWKKVVIASKDWKTITNNLTGAILSRELTAAITYKAFDGKCGYEYVTFAQEYTGAGKYSSTLRFSASGGGSHMSCDHIE